MSKKSILLVDDDFMNVRLAQYILESEGYFVVRAATARQTLEQLALFTPDLILMDIQLPDIDGRVLIKTLRQQPEIRDVKILALTACAMKGDRERILNTGFNDYISKPIDITTFLTAVRRYA